MKKIVRLTESDLVKLVKRVISEQLLSSPAPSKSTNYKSIVQGGVPKPSSKVATVIPQDGKTGINFYNDITEKRLFKSHNIDPGILEKVSSQGDYFIKIGFSMNDERYTYSCNNKVFNLNGMVQYPKYNKGYSEYLQNNYCPKTTKSSGGATVPDVKWVQNNQSDGTQVA